MDPQKLAQLDPKLREAYQRVMGTPIPTLPTTSTPVQTPLSDSISSIPVAEPTPEPTAPISDSIPTPQPQPEPTQEEPTSTPEPQPESTSTPIVEPSARPEPFFKPQTEPDPLLPQQPVTEPQPAIDSEPSVPPIAESIPEPTAPIQPTSNFTQMDSEVQAASSQNFATPPMPQAQTIVKKKSGIMMPILFVIVGLVFLVIYTFFWTKIFNFKLPFLP